MNTDDLVLVLAPERLSADTTTVADNDDSQQHSDQPPPPPPPHPPVVRQRSSQPDLKSSASPTPPLPANARGNMSSAEWYSLAAYMHIRFLGGPLSMLKPKRRYYFVLDEINSQLVYFKDENEFIRRKEHVGMISLRHCAVQMPDTGAAYAFVIRCPGNRNYELEAPNEQAATVWLHALQNRKDEADPDPIVRLPSSLYGSGGHHQQQQHCNGGLTRQLSSTSLPSDAEMVAALDSAFEQASSSSGGNNSSGPGMQQSPTTAGRQQPPATRESFCNQRTFYFSATPDDGRSTVDDRNSVHNNDLMTASYPPPDPDQRSSGGNADALQHWIRNWLHDQPSFDNGSDTETDNVRFEQQQPQETPSPVNSQPDYHTQIELAKLRAENVALRAKEADYRKQISTLNAKLKLCQEQMKAVETSATTTAGGEQTPAQLQASFLHSQNKFLNSEVLRLSAKWHDDKSQVAQLSRRVVELESSVDEYKQQYVHLLQSCIRMPVSDRRPIDAVEVKLFGGDVHKVRVCGLLDECREVDPTLPTYESLVNGNCHVDMYGFRHSFTEEPLALHYIATQLHWHYQAQQGAQQQHKQRWKVYLAKSKNILLNSPETRQLVRQGIPPSYRSAIWRCLIHQQVVDLKLKFGKYYYRNLCSSQNVHDMEHAMINQKQITLDLLRTMPNNVHFSSPTCKGVNQLQQVLRAFCLHNPTIGYCQGMNFVGATALLFLSPEDAFWFLVAVTERYFVPSYFDSSLTGAQADQEVLKELVAIKLPHLSDHLQRCDIDLATITLNWFLPLFFDALPFQTMLRVWDCFLLEGPKTLFRFAVALLCLNETTIMEKTDTISVMKIIKGTAKLTYDVDGLLQVAFAGLKPFPKRRELVTKQTCYLRLLRERLKQKRQLRNAAITDTPSPPDECPGAQSLQNSLPLDAVVFDVAAGTALLAFGNQNAGKLAIINISTGRLQQQALEFDCRIVSLLFAEQVQLGFLSLVSGYLVAFSADRNTCRRQWELRMADTVLHMVYHGNRLYAALANGSLAVMENCASNSPTAVELYYIPIGPAPLACLATVNEQQLWVATGNKAVVLNLKTLDCVEQVFVAANTSGACVSFFDKMLCLQHSADGVWLATAHSSLVQLWDPVTFTCRLLFDISSDHNSRRSTAPTDHDVDAQITALMCHENTLWVGTADGYLIVYEKQRRNASPSLNARCPSASSGSSNRHSLVSSADRRSGSKQSEPVTPTKHSPTEDKSAALVASVSQSSGYGSQTDYTGGSSNALHPNNSESASNSSMASGSQQQPRPVRQRIARRKAVIARTKSTAAMHAGQPAASDRRYRNRTISGSHVTVAPLLPDSFGRSTKTDQKRTPGEGTENGGSDHKLHGSRWSSVSMNDLGTFGSLRKKSGATLLERLRSATSFSSVHTYDASTDNMHYDELFAYSDDANAARTSGGLCTTTLARTESVWSLQGHPLPLQQLPANSANQSPSVATPDSLDPDHRQQQQHNFGGSGIQLHINDSNGNPQQQMETPPVTIRRKDLTFDDNMSTVTGGRHSPSDAASCYFAMSETASVLSINSTVDPPFAYQLTLCMKLKISDKAVKCLAVTRSEKEPIVISCAGNYGDDEAVLKWTKEHATGLWLNNPVVDVAQAQQQQQQQMLQAASRRNSRTTGPTSRSSSVARR